MIVFETYINGVLACRSGAAGVCVSTVMLTHQKRSDSEAGDIDLGFGAYVPQEERNLHWPSHLIRVGDEIKIVVAEGEKVDAATTNEA